MHAKKAASEKQEDQHKPDIYLRWAKIKYLKHHMKPDRQESHMIIFKESS